MKMKHCRPIRWAVCLLAGLLAVLCIGAAAPSESGGRVLRVAFPELDGISELDQAGNPKGLLVDYLNEIAKYTGWSYEYIPASSEELVSDFLDGQYDLMGGTFYSPGFEEYFAFPDYSTGRSRAVLLCRKDDERLHSYDLTSLKGMTIGVYSQASEKIRHLKEFLASNDLDCQLRFYTLAEMDEAGTLYTRLRTGEVDMILGNNLEVGGEFRMVTSFQAQPYYIVTTVGNTEILEGLNQSLARILESTPNFTEDTFNANFPDIREADVQLNQEELRYIAAKKTISVAVPSKWHPFYCPNSPSEHHTGLLPNLLQEISDFTGLEFTYVQADTYADALALVQQGQADLLGIFMDGDTQAFSSGLALTQPYISLSNIVLKHKSVSYPGSDLTCGILRGRTLPATFEAAEIYSYDTVPEMVAAVNRGDVDYIYGVSATLEQEMQNHRYLNVVPVTQVSSTTRSAFAIPQPISPELLTLLNKAISNISTDEKTDMLNQNLVSVGYSSLSLQDLIYANPVAFILIFGLVLLMGTAGVLLIIQSRMKNALMKSQLAAAEAKSLAKSEFLARMSHEIRTPMNAIIGLTDLTCMEQGVPPEVTAKLQKIRGSSQYLLSLINDILDMSRIEHGRMELDQKDFSMVDLLDALQAMMSTQAEQKGLTFREERQVRHDVLSGDPVRLRQVLTNLLSNAIKFTPAGGTVSLRVEEMEGDEQGAAYRFSVSDTGVGIPLDAQEQIFSSFEQLSPSTSTSVGTGLGLPISRSIARLMGGDLQVHSQPGEGSEFYMTLRFPLGSQSAPQPETADALPSLEGVRVLLAEDNDLNAEIAQELLTLQGMEVRRAANGQEAVDLFLSTPPGTFQVILMDIRMPIKDGHQAAQDIRSSGRPDADIPIIAMTANSFQEDEEAARTSGMNGFAPKPVEPNYLFSIIKKFL